MRVAHVITGLLVGGAETALARLLAAQSRAAFPALVISLLPEGPMAAPIRASGVEVVSLGMARGVPSLAGLLRMRRALAAFRPDLVQGWMYHGNLAALLGARSAGLRVPVLWNIRQSLADLSREPRGTRLVIQAGARLAGGVRRVIYNSNVARAQHEPMGYHRSPGVVIPNGFDTTRLVPSAEARRALREELGLGPEALVVGMVNRLHPMKGHGTFLEAARLVRDAGVPATFVAAGRGVTGRAPELAAVVARLGLAGEVRLLGERDDAPKLFAGFDVACMASGWGEGFPNVVAEAMACGTPCVVTDVGDAAVIVGDPRLVVPPGDARALALAIRRLLESPPDSRQAEGGKARARVIEHFSLERCTTAYQRLYHRMVTSSREAQ